MKLSFPFTNFMKIDWTLIGCSNIFVENLSDYLRALWLESCLVFDWHLVINNYVFKNGLEEWKKIFYLGSSVYIASAGVFIFFGTGEMQPWNEISVDEEKDNFEVDSLEARKESDGIHSQKWYLNLS